MKVVYFILAYTITSICLAQTVTIVTTENTPVEFCHVCDKTLEHCTITGLDGQFDLSPFVQLTDTLVLKHVGLKVLRLPISAIGDQIIMPLKIEELQNVYVLDVGPKELFRKVIERTTSKSVARKIVRKGQIQILGDTSLLNSKMVNDTLILEEMNDSESLLPKFIRMQHGAMSLAYLDDYHYEIVGYYENGMVIVQKMKGLSDRFHFKYFVNDDLIIEEMFFVYHFKEPSYAEFNESARQKYLWQGHIIFEITDQSLVPSSLVLEEHFLVKESGTTKKSMNHQLGIFKFDPID